MIPPIDASRAGALHIESMAHENGWDNPPVLLQLRGHVIPGATVLEGAELHFRQALPDGNPAVYLRAMADQFGDGHMLAEAARSLARPTFCGLAFLCEGWMRTGDESVKTEARTRKFADMPGSVEIRSACIVDTAGRLTYALRRRGQAPEVWVGGEEDFVVGGGRVPSALRDMVLAIALHMPFGSADLDALRGIKLDAERG